MTIQSDKWIKKMCLEHNMIEPFIEEQVSSGRISYGLSSFGYDVRVADEYKIFTNLNSSTIDPKNFDESNFVDRKGSECIIPPNSFALARTIEYFKIPKDIMCICVGKSTYARCGIVINVTPIENEFEGRIVIEISNTTPNPAKIYSNEGIAQFYFLKETSSPKLLINLEEANIRGKRRSKKQKLSSYGKICY